MDELTALDDLGTALDHPADLRALRSRMLTDLRAGPRRRFHVKRPLLVCFAATATAALIVVPSLLLIDRPERSLPAATPSAEPTSNGRRALATRAEKAAATGRPLTMPDNDQYVYVETRDSSRPRRVSREWLSVDHKRPDVVTDYQTGRLRWNCFLRLMDPPDQWATDFTRPPAHCPVNNRSWAVPSDVPVTPAAFAAWFQKRYPDVNGDRSLLSRAHIFLNELQLLDSRVTPSLFLMLIRRPEVKLVDPDRDQLGRTVVGLTAGSDLDTDTWVLLYDPYPFAYRGRRQIRPQAGTETEYSVVRMAVVDRVGQRPE